MVVPNKRDYYGETKTDELELPLFDFMTLVMATNNFSNSSKLGQGGFGCVYKVKYLFYVLTIEIPPNCIK